MGGGVEWSKPERARGEWEEQGYAGVSEVGEGVGRGVGVGRRVIFVFFGVWKGKRGAGGFFRFSIFWRAALWLGRFLCWCV